MSEQTGDQGRTKRGFGRWLAPSALIAVGAAVAIIITQNNHPSSSTTATLSGTGTTETMASTKETRSTPSTTHGHVATYTVRSGDTLSKIAVHLHTTVAALEAANPSTASGSLKIGQVLKLK